MNSYSTISLKYEKLVKDCDYDKWSQYLLININKYSLGKKGLDLACGSGIITRALSKNGFKMTGGDISEQMLVQAKNISDMQKLNIPFYLVDLNNFTLPEKFDFVTIINDGINYIKQDKLEKVFKNIYKVLNKNGLLIFDISSKYKLKNVLGNNLFGEDLQDFSYLWFNTLHENYVEMDISCFTKCGDLYKKSEENHIQYIHNVEDIKKALQNCKFKVELIEGDKGESLREESQRINFIAIKNG